VCLIVDADASDEFLAKPGAVRDWLLDGRKSPRLVAAGKLREELARAGDVRRLLTQLERAGRLRPADAAELRREEDRLRADGRCRSNDRHVLALAVVSGARTLATFDNDLARDFRNAEIICRPRGSVYRNPAAHARLLRHTASCGVRSAPDRRGSRDR
jgi:predicted nucleic acid-binding protein